MAPAPHTSAMSSSHFGILNIQASFSMTDVIMISSRDISFVRSRAICNGQAEFNGNPSPDEVLDWNSPHTTETICIP